MNKLNIKIYQENDPMFRVNEEITRYYESDYHKVFERTEDADGYLNQTNEDILEGLFEEFNCGDYPEDYKGHSMSVGDIVVITRMDGDRGSSYGYICCSFGWKNIMFYPEGYAEGECSMCGLKTAFNDSDYVSGVGNVCSNCMGKTVRFQ